jgi:hypothetical protein
MAAGEAVEVRIIERVQGDAVAQLAWCDRCELPG